MTPAPNTPEEKAQTTTEKQIKTDTYELELDPFWSERTLLAAIGDTFELTVKTAPELNRMTTISGDGQLHLPLIGSIPAIGRTPDRISEDISLALASELIDPSASLSLMETAAPKIYVGGAVERPGEYDLKGMLTPLQAVILAGGSQDTDKPLKISTLRRLSENRIAAAEMPITETESPHHGAVLPLLTRYDIVYVSRAAEPDLAELLEERLQAELPSAFLAYYRGTDLNR